MDLLIIFLFSLGCYLIGSILTGAVVARIKKVNLRNQGSGNIGATNAFRSMGWLFGAIVLLGDAFKGMIAVWLGRRLGTVYGIDLSVLGGVLVIVGHNWSVWAGFRGGKGIATTLGVIIGLTPLTLLIVLPVWLGVFFLSGYVSLASIIAALGYPVATLFLYSGEADKLILAVALGVLAIYRHRSNMVRLLHGEEHRILYKNKRGAKQG